MNKLIPLQVPWQVSSVQIENIEFQEIYVTMNFLGGIVRTMPALTDTCPIDVSKYDWTDIDLDFQPYRPTELADWKRVIERSREIWFKTGICPTPHIYEVQDSEWLESLKSQIAPQVPATK